MGGGRGFPRKNRHLQLFSQAPGTRTVMIHPAPAAGLPRTRPVHPRPPRAGRDAGKACFISIY